MCTCAMKRSENLEKFEAKRGCSVQSKPDNGRNEQKECNRRTHLFHLRKVTCLPRLLETEIEESYHASEHFWQNDDDEFRKAHTENGEIIRDDKTRQHGDDPQRLGQPRANPAFLAILEFYRRAQVDAGEDECTRQNPASV